MLLRSAFLYSIVKLRSDAWVIVARLVMLLLATPGTLETTRTVRLPLVLLLASAVLLLVIACGNVASLLLGETAVRDVEIATRVSLGAKPSRVARQLLTENLLLGSLGGVAGAGRAPPPGGERAGVGPDRNTPNE